MKDWPTFKEAIQSRADTLTPRHYVTPRVRTGSSAVLCQSNRGQDWLQGDAQKGARERQDGQQSLTDLGGRVHRWRS
jgi:hypothetical protein